MDAYEKGADLAEALYVKLGETLSAPVNFMCSGDYFRYLEQLESPSDRSDFAKGYRDTWTWKNIRKEL